MLNQHFVIRPSTVKSEIMLLERAKQANVKAARHVLTKIKVGPIVSGDEYKAKNL